MDKSTINRQMTREMLDSIEISKVNGQRLVFVEILCWDWLFAHGETMIKFPFYLLLQFDGLIVWWFDGLKSPELGIKPCNPKAWLLVCWQQMTSSSQRDREIQLGSFACKSTNDQKLEQSRVIGNGLSFMNLPRVGCKQVIRQTRVLHAKTGEILGRLAMMLSRFALNHWGSRIRERFQHLNPQVKRDEMTSEWSEREMWFNRATSQIPHSWEICRQDSAKFCPYSPTMREIQPNFAVFVSLPTHICSKIWVMNSKLYIITKVRKQTQPGKLNPKSNASLKSWPEKHSSIHHREGLFGCNLSLFSRVI